MRKKKIYGFTIFAALAALSVIAAAAGSYPVRAQKQNNETSASQQVPRIGEYSYADGRAGMSEKEAIACGPASRNPTYYARSPLHKIDLSFGLIPAGDRLGDTERVVGSWAVRAIFPAEAGRPETVSNIYFHGGFSGGSLPTAGGKGGGGAFDLYGSTNFTGSMCLMKGGGDTERRHVRISGVCGENQEVVFEVSTRPPVNQNGIVYFNEGDIFASGRFRGDVSCGRTADAGRVRTNLTRN